MESKRQLIDSLTSHISLYNSHSASSSSSSSNPNPNPRSSILKWFSSLTPHQRQSHLTIVDKSFTQLLIQLQFKLKNNGHGSFIILPDIPSSSNPNIPSFCFRKSHGLLTRISERSIPEKYIRESVQLFDSKEGENFGSSCSTSLDSLTVSRHFVENVDTFVDAMDGVSNGEFLRGEESVLLGSLDWVEFNWLKVKGYYSLEAFVANRLELALRLSWLHLNIGKKRGVKLKEKSVCTVAGVAANVYWRKKGCVDWWMKLDDQMKNKVFQMALGKATRLLTQEILHGRSSGMEDELQTIETLKDIESRQSLFISQSDKLSSISHKFNRLLVVCEISTMLKAFEHGQFDEGVLFFTTLGSVTTISDRVLRRLRGLLMVVSLDFTKLELLEDFGSTKSTKKPKPKLDSSKKGKTRDVKKSIPVQKSFKGNSIPEKPAKDEREKSCGVVHEKVIEKETQSTPIETVINGTIQSTSKKGKRARKKHKKDGVTVNNPTKNPISETTPSKPASPQNPTPNNPDTKITPNAIPASIPDKNSKTQVVNVITSTNLSSLENSNIECENVKEMMTKKEQKPVVNYGHGIVNSSRNPPNEWPYNGPQLSFVNSHLPTTTDRLHLDVGHNWQNHYHQSGFLHNRTIDEGTVHPRPIMSLDWPPMVHSFNTLVPFLPRRPSFDRIYSGEFDSPEFVEDHDGQFVGDEDFAVSGMDYSQFFGGGVMYWDSSDHPVAGFSRPPSLSSDDSSWAWQEADMNRTVDDMVAFSSPSGASFCSAFDPLGYVIPGEVAGKVAGKVPDDYENVSPSLDIEAKTGDLFPYPILRPIIINRSREFKRTHEHKSPCVPPSRREEPPPVKRPPSPVVLCVPRGAPVADSRKQRGFPTVRSGSSSPRNWGVKGWFHDGINFEEACLRVDGSEVVWPSWRKKSQIPGALIAISHENHPDLAIPIQSPESESVKCTVLPVMHNLLNDEIDSFCKRVAGVNLTRKPYINWAVKRVTRSLQVLWPRSRTNIFGSNATGLSLPTSDVDLVVCLPPVRNLEPIKEAGILEGRNGIKETCLQHAARYLANQEWVKNDSLKIVENTAIPIIMLVVQVPSDLVIPTPESGSEKKPESESIRIDISFKAPSHTGLQTTELVKELTEQFPAATPLALVLKQFLADRSLDQSYSGGLSSYCLILLITRFLQHEHHYGRPINQNFGGLLMDFLYFFGNVFDPRQMRISVQGSGVYINRERGYSIDPIYIDDPLYPANNVGRNCFRIHQCIKAFADAYSTLEDRLVSISSDSCDSSNLKLLPLIIPSVGPL
ncbi:hypothetical protein L2E82_45621 [Cichorium intybus]|uniref:Uncharacterized protein n=1 Tax=Cichorium intybus TaxID=13427 RepID=A0ACB8ZUD2_CICIN|nr:hypothetical protein L2E82_45621 [Cichorium intybus]